MNKKVLETLLDWPKPYIAFEDLTFNFGGSKAAKYGLINRAIKEGMIEKLRRGLYRITLPGRKDLVDPYELAQVMYAPSFITKESALQYHQVIPEAVYTICSGTTRKTCSLENSIGNFVYHKLPSKDYFYLGVERVENSKGSVFFMANPWRAIADIIYLNKKSWNNLAEIEQDMRLDLDYYRYRKELWELIDEYPNQRTRSVLKRLV